MKKPRRRAVTSKETNTVGSVEDQYAAISPIATAMIPDRQGKKRWYGTHQFFTRRAWNIVQAYIENFAPTADAVVYDPFSGSGVTAVEAAILGKKGLASDINPFAVFYGNAAGCNYHHPMRSSQSELIPKFEKVLEYFHEHFNKNLRTDNQLLKEAKRIGVPQKKLLDHRVNCKTFEMHTPMQLYQLALLKKGILMLRYSDQQTKQLLLFVFSATVSKCNKTFVSAKGRKASRGGARIFSSFAMNLPPTPVEIEVFAEFQSKFKKLLQAKQEIFGEMMQRTKIPISISQFPAQHASKHIEPESVDYIFTDPPYGKLIPYMDLSSFFCDWLDLPISQETRQLDIIENSSMHRTKNFYYGEMKKAFAEMFTVLKYDRWLTLVYAHRDTEYWDAIITACQDEGFEFVNAVYEKPEVIWSLTKKKNKSTTFAGELYLNFRKSRSPRGKLISLFKKDFRRIIRNTVELAIVHNEGCATIEDVYSELVPVLARHGMTGRFRQEQINIRDYLEQDFIFDKHRCGYEPPQDRKLSSFIPIDERVLFYVRDFLIEKRNRGQAATFDEIISNVLPNLVNGDIPSRDSIKDVLKRVGSLDVNRDWLLSDEPGEAQNLQLPISPPLPKIEPKTSRHNVVAWKLLYIGSKASLTPYLGLNEQQDKALNNTGIPYVKKLKLKRAKSDLRKIEQIDVVWLQNEVPLFAFEIEESTTILSALDRFSHLMDACPDIARKKRFVIVIPKRRIRKLTDVLTHSTYIGKPLYFENKLRILYTEDVDKLYDKCKNHYCALSKFEAALRRFEDL